MNRAGISDLTTSRFEVRSIDGTSLAVFVSGQGPPLVMVHGSIADHTTFDGFVEVLRQDFTTFCLDRRGSGASGDATPYSIEREFEDVAAVVDAVATRTRSRVTLWGHSYGASCAMGAATLTDNADHLVLYEPSLGLRYPPGSIEKIEATLDRDDREATILEVLTGVLEMSNEEVAAMKASPLWPIRVASAHTVPRECREEERWEFEPGQFDGIAIPTLLLSGSDSVPEVVRATHAAAGAIPGSQIRVLTGHGHFAHKSDPFLVAGVIGDYTSR